MVKKRILTFHITEPEAGLTVKQYLMKTLGFSAHQVGRLKFHEDGIRVNGERVYVSHVLEEGDILAVALTQHARRTEGGGGQKVWLAPASGLADLYPPEILYEDEDLLIMNKPAGIVCHPSFGHFNDTLANQAAEHLGVVGTDAEIRVTGRLDRETSGIVVFAKNTETAALLQRQRENGEIRKIYLALAEGIVPKEEGVIDSPIRREAPGSHRMITAPDGKEAKTFYEVLRTDTGRHRTLLMCRIEHGRMHQIRVHMASVGCPLVGDPLYNPQAAAGETMGLHAFCLSLRQPFGGSRIRIEAAAPDWAQVYFTKSRI